MTQYHFEDNFRSEELEAGLLVALTREPDRFWDVADLLPAKAWTVHRNRFIQVLEIIGKGSRDFSSVDLPKAGADGISITEAARTLEDLFRKRLWARELQNSFEALNQSLKNGQTATELISEYESGLAKVAQTFKELESGKMKSGGDLLPKVVEEARAKWALLKSTGRKFIGLPTGLKSFDELLGGLQEGIHLLAAEAGKGKTTFALQMALNVAKENCPVLFVTFEESVERLAMKALCHLAKLEAKSFFDGFGDPGKLEQARVKNGHEMENLYFLWGDSRLDVSAVEAMALKLKSQYKTDRCLIVIDYLQKWASTKKNFTDFRHVVGALAGNLRELSHGLKIPILAICSQNRPGQDVASLTSLKECGDLEYVADSVTFLISGKDDRNDKLQLNSSGKKRAVDLEVKKNRFGDIGRVELVFEPAKGRFGEVDKRS